jgi:disulfide bond formation protein DsbB
MFKDDIVKVVMRDFDWLLVISLSAVFFSGAIFYEYAFDMPPCYLCVQQRALVLGILLSSLFGYAFYTKNIDKPTKLKDAAIILSVCINITFALLAFEIASEHLATSTSSEFSFLFSSCETGTPFPSFMPLDQWLPFLFGVKASCADGMAEALGLKMPVYILYFGMLVTAFSCVKMILVLSGRH